MPEEIFAAVEPIQPNVVIDGTYGGGGHSERLLAALPAENPNARIFGLDRDPEVLHRTETESLDPRIEVFLVSYEFADRALELREMSTADAMILDLGLSSDQLDSDRGFSFHGDGPLDLRFDPENGEPAWKWLLRADSKEIADVIYRFGEERFSRRIAKEIVHQRAHGEPIKTVARLSELCRRCVPRSKNHDIHPATRTFQAIRIHVNDELGGLERTLAKAPNWLRPGGRMAILSFHSLEDRIVKWAFRDDPRWGIITRKPILPTEIEISANSRSRSAKLRIAERVEEPMPTDSETGRW